MLVASVAFGQRTDVKRIRPLPTDSSSVLGYVDGRWGSVSVDAVTYLSRWILIGSQKNPNTFYSAVPGTLFLSTLGTADSTLWVKETGTDSLGWAPK